MLSQGTEEGAGGQEESRAASYDGVGFWAALVSKDQEECPLEGLLVTPVGEHLQEVHGLIYDCHSQAQTCLAPCRFLTGHRCQRRGQTGLRNTKPTRSFLLFLGQGTRPEPLLLGHKNSF